MTKKAVNVIKVPLDNKNITNDDTNKKLPRMPRMYLELLENKDKIKPSMVNQEYDPEEVMTQITFDDKSLHNNDDNSESVDINNDDNFSEISNNEDDYSNNNDDIITKSENENIISENFLENYDNDDNNNNDAYSISSNSNSNSNSLISNKSSSIMDDNHSSFQNVAAFQNKPFQNVPAFQNEPFQNEPFQNKLNPYQYQNNETKDKLKQILNNVPPKLSELDVNQKKIIPNLVNNMNSIESMEEEDELKRELLYKFDILKKSYKNVDIPHFTMHSDYRQMNKTYENTLRRVSLDSNVENYKSYMIVAFMIIEYVMGIWLKFDMAGFTQQQILNMTQYDRLLIELGEKSYVPTDKQWPVELRLLGLILMNTIIFLVAKIIIKKTGTNVLGLIQTTSSGFNNESKSSNSSTTSKRKMKGPNIDFQAIPNLDKKEEESIISSILSNN